MSNVLKFAHKEKQCLKPTDNQISAYMVFFDRLIRYLEFHATISPATRPVDDLVRLRNAIVRASYVTILFDKILDMNRDLISVEFDMSVYVQQIMRLMNDDVHESTQTPISIARVVEVDQLLQVIIETYYFNQVQRPWWKFWG